MKPITVSFAIAYGLVACTLCLAQATKHNILVIFGDDIGTTNVSTYSDGLMGYETPDNEINRP